MEADLQRSGYQLPEGPLLHRRPGRRQWHYSHVCSELETQLKAHQTYEQATGEAPLELWGCLLGGAVRSGLSKQEPVPPDKAAGPGYN